MLTTKQAAQRARVSDRTIRRAITAGRISVAARAGRAYLITPADVADWTMRNRQ
ncbi:MAG: helix-turn-helix domain-containing protein [Pseudonocardiaceae bacterium]